MKAILLVLFAFSLMQLSWATGDVKSQKLTDAQIRKLLIAQSIQSYSGNCPCPYSTMRNGRSCGGRSAWSKPGGYAPLCYEKDVTNEMVDQWRRTKPGTELNE